MPRPIDPARDEARARRDKRYISTKACPHGHLGERFVISASCCTCADIARAERLGDPGKTKVKKKPTPQQHAENIEAAASRFHRPAFVHTLADCNHTIAARERSNHLDSLIKNLTASRPKVPQHDTQE